MQPYPVGTIVRYHGNLERYHGLTYKITGYCNPAESRPEVIERYSAAELAEYYPDGAAYDLWPEGVPYKPTRGKLALNSVQRGSITPKGEDDG